MCVSDDLRDNPLTFEVAGRHDGRTAGRNLGDRRCLTSTDWPQWKDQKLEYKFHLLVPIPTTVPTIDFDT
jgi:hypothetical protein